MNVRNVRDAQGGFARGAKIKGGCVCLAPGKSVGEHTTGSGEEIVLVLEGRATVHFGGESRELGKDECVFIPQETLHDVANRTENNLVYVYFVGGK
jgi:mannose-6-phosphate isomerase-like protein (cupin superfamily)